MPSAKKFFVRSAFWPLTPASAAAVVASFVIGTSSRR